MNLISQLKRQVGPLLASKIGKRIVLLTVLTSGLITLVATLLQMALEYQSQFNAVAERHHEIQQIHVPELAIALWNFNDVMLQQRLDGLVELPQVSHIQVRSEDRVFSAGQPSDSHYKVSSTLPIDYQSDLNESEHLGEIYVESDTKAIYQSLIRYFFVTLAVNGAKTLVVCLVILFFIHRIINLRIFAISHHLKRFKPQNDYQPLQLPFANEALTKGDEIERLSSQVNELTRHITTLYGSLKQEHQRFSQFAKVSSDWLWETNQKDELIYASEQMKISLQLKTLPTPLQSIPAFARSTELLALLLGRIDPVHAEERINQEGTIQYLLFRAMAHNEGGIFMGYRGTALDVTELIESQIRLKELNHTLEEKVSQRTSDLHQSLEQLRLAQEQLIESEKLSALGNLVAGVAHEVNTPLGVTITSTSILGKLIDELNLACKNNSLTKSQLDEFIQKANHAVDLLYTNLERAENLIRSFKQTAADQISEIRVPFNLHHVLSDLLISLEPETGKMSVQTTLQGECSVEINSYPGVLTQVLTNFVMNSLKHAFAEEEDPQITITCHELDELVEIRYVDNGKGVPEHLQQKVFEPFFTTNREGGGTGLGLTLCYNLVTKKLKGQLTFSSQLGQGVCFTLILPKQLPSEESSPT